MAKIGFKAKPIKNLQLNNAILRSNVEQPKTKVFTPELSVFCKSAMAMDAFLMRPRKVERSKVIMIDYGERDSTQNFQNRRSTSNSRDKRLM